MNSLVRLRERTILLFNPLPFCLSLRPINELLYISKIRTNPRIVEGVSLREWDLDYCNIRILCSYFTDVLFVETCLNTVYEKFLKMIIYTQYIKWLYTVYEMIIHGIWKNKDDYLYVYICTISIYTRYIHIYIWHTHVHMFNTYT